MGFRVYEEPLASVLDEAIVMLNANRDHAVGRERFDWLYRQNPDGQAILWSIRKEETGEMAGFTVAIPRRIWVDGTTCLCWNCADFSVSAKYRVLGIAVKLRRASREGVDAARVRFLYSHPNARMQTVCEKAGNVPVGTMIRYSKPLRSEPYLKRHLTGTTLPRLVAAAVDPVLRLRSAERRHRFSCRTRVVPGLAFDDRFDDLFERASRGRRIVGVRDARYLNWRYHQNPLYETHGVLAEAEGRLSGYLVFTIQGATADLKDIFALDDDTAQRDLIAAAIRWAREAGLENLSIAVLEGHPAIATLERFGFVQRPDNSQMVAYASPHSDLSLALHRPGEWLISVGDRDV